MKKSILSKFLEKNSISPSKVLPLVHSSDSYVIKRALKEGVLRASRCDTFQGEDLLYFFVGRPAYKKETNEEAEYWELPSCIVFDFDITKAKRIFPFDSGAFKRGFYPSYINMMNIEDFELEGNKSKVERAIGTFFRNSRDYYRLTPISREKFEAVHDVDVTDEEILALHRLIGDRSRKSDDRRFSIEVQFAESFEFSRRKPMLAIVPENYLDSKIFMSWIRRHDVEISTYPYYPLRKEYYYSAIYEKLDFFYRENGYYEV